jgi:hypothetical protein
MAQRTFIPPAVAAEVADVLSSCYTHAELDNRFQRAGVSDEPPIGGNKLQKASAYLRRANNEETLDPLVVLGRVLSEFMTKSTFYDEPEWKQIARARIERTLAENGFSYQEGGRILGGVAAPSRTLGDKLRERDLPALDVEFGRALENVERDPGSAVTASCAILEAAFKVYIETERLTMPGDQSILPLWRTVRNDLGLDPASLADRDLQRVLGGLSSIVDGIGAFRTHAGSAHGGGSTPRTVEPREARLAVHAAHTVTAFLLEASEAKKGGWH